MIAYEACNYLNNHWKGMRCECKKNDHASPRHKETKDKNASFIAIDHTI